MRVLTQQPKWNSGSYDVRRSGAFFQPGYELSRHRRGLSDAELAERATKKSGRTGNKWVYNGFDPVGQKWKSWLQHLTRSYPPVRSADARRQPFESEGGDFDA